MLDDVGVGREDAHELPDVLDRLSSGDFAGSGIRLMSLGIGSLAVAPCRSPVRPTPRR
jgi:hypothetical protein